MSETVLTAFHPGVSVHEQPDGAVAITLHTQTILIKSPSDGLRHAIQCLASTGVAQTELDQQILAHDGIGGLSNWYYWRRQFQELRLLYYPIEIQHSRIATLLSASLEPVVPPLALEQTVPFVLSRFAYCRLDSEQGCLRIESPLSPFSLLLHDSSGGLLIGALSMPKTLQELRQEISVDPERVERLLAWLVFTRMVVTIDAEDPAQAECHPALPYWEFHDLLFHSRSRMGRSTASFGGTYRFGQDNPPCPVVKPNMSNEIYPLHRPEPEQLLKQDPSFSAVLAARKSCRTFDDQHPLTFHQVGEFLDRVARVQQLLTSPLPDSKLELSKRPYPAGGALYELDIYLIVHHCLDVPQGLYQYNPLHHHLCKLMANTSELEQFVQHCQSAAQFPREAPSQPQVVFLITSRFQRISWKYESIAYATTLKNTGALYQTMYLAAAVMGLGGTAIGCGDSDLFARMTGIDYYEEALVGEFVLGTTIGRVNRSVQPLPGDEMTC